MKLVIASDIHGSAFWCGKLLEVCEKEQPDHLVLLGDILYHGPRNDLPDEYAPKKVIEMLNPLKDKLFCVRGNCEAEVDQMVLEFPVLAEYALLETGKNTIFITHGHKYNTSNLPPLSSGDILLHGHTHIPACEKYGNVMYLNPGSAAIPKNGSWHGYMTLENGLFIWKDFDGCEKMRYEVQKNV